MRVIAFIITLMISNLVFAEYLFSEKGFQAHKRWSSYSDNETNNIKNLFRKLIKSRTGKLLVREAQLKAHKSGLKILDIVKAGRGSLTDTTLIRKFSAHTPDDISYESKSIIYINNELTQYDAVLDLAHELTHYVYRQNFNPYELNFTLTEFIKNTIEGKGGEVQAFIMECNVQKELFPLVSDNRYNCKKIADEDTGKYSISMAVKRFYQVGSYFESFDNILKKHGIRSEFPDITSDQVSFISSAYGIPYPVAAFEEYLSVINKVCENDLRRINYFKKSKGRAPASLSKIQKNYDIRCRDL